jgi:hypothetical protein
LRHLSARDLLIGEQLDAVFAKRIYALEKVGFCGALAGCID